MRLIARLFVKRLETLVYWAYKVLDCWLDAAGLGVLSASLDCLKFRVFKMFELKKLKAIGGLLAFLVVLIGVC